MPRGSAKAEADSSTRENNVTRPKIPTALPTFQGFLCINLFNVTVLHGSSVSTKVPISWLYFPLSGLDSQETLHSVMLSLLGPEAKGKTNITFSLYFILYANI
jgi:hypothetical protein